MEKRIKSLHGQVVVSLVLPWFSLEIYRKHFTGHRNMSLPNAKFFCELLRRLENLTVGKQTCFSVCGVSGIEEFIFDM